MFILCSVDTPLTNPAAADTLPGDRNPEAVPAEPPRSQVLLNVLTLIIQAGAAFLANIAGKMEPHEVQSIADAFGTFNLSVIVARVFRGLRLANALKRRVAATETRIDHPRPVRATVSHTDAPRGPRRRKPTDAHDNGALLANVPTEAEIAAMLKNRTIGAVLADICADLGIVPGHP
jgi:hypothetical protein